MASGSSDIKSADLEVVPQEQSPSVIGWQNVLKGVKQFAMWLARFVIRSLAELTAVCLGLGIISLGLLTSIMAKGEADVSFLKQNFALWFAQAYDGQDADISSFKVKWHPEHRSLGFRVEDIIVKDKDDEPLLTIGSIYAESSISGLLKGGFEARRLDLEGGQFTVRRYDNGAIFGAVGDPDSFGLLGPIIPIAGSSAGREDNVIDSVSFAGTDVFFRDDLVGASLNLGDVNFLTEISDTEVLANGRANIISSLGGSAKFDEDINSAVSVVVKRERSGDRALDVSIDIQNFNFSDVIEDESQFNALKQIDRPIHLTSRFRNVNAQERRISFEVKTADQRAGLSVPYLGAIKDVGVAGEWDLASDKLDLNVIRIVADDMELRGQADISDVLSLAQDDRGEVKFSLEIDQFVWAADNVLSKSLEVMKGKVSGEYLAKDSQFILSNVNLPISDYVIKANADLKNIADALKGEPNLATVKINGNFDGDLSESDFLGLWPTEFILGGRNWVKSSIVSATLSGMTFDVDISDLSKLEGGLPDDSITLDFQVRDGVVQYIRTMTPLDQAQGYGRLRANGLELTLTAGRVGEMAIESGRVDIPQFFPYGNNFTIEFQGHGPMDYMVELIDQKPFEYASIYNLDPQDFSGKAEARLKITRPLREHFDQSLITYDVEVKGYNVDAPFGLGNYKLTEGELFLTANKDGMTIKGPAKIGPLDAEINWRENFDFGATPTQLNLTSHIDNAALDKFGLSLREYFGGDVPFTLEATGEGVAFDEAKITANLIDSEWVIGDFWSKPKGEAGDLKLTLGVNRDGQVTIKNLDANAPGLNINGALKLDRDFRLLEGNLNAFEIADLVSARATLNREAIDQPLQATLSGNFLNLDGIISSTLVGAGGGAQVPLILTANMNILRLADDYEISKASLLYNHSGTTVDQFRFSGGSSDGPVVLDLRTFQDGPFSSRLTFDIANASDALGAFFELDSLQGGRLYGEAIRPRSDIGVGDNPTWSGTVNVDEFKLVNAPFLAQILSLASLDGFSNVLNGEGLEFETVEVPFTWGQGVLGLESARAAGPALGLTGDGTIDMSGKIIDVDGTLIPAYAANSFLGSIPILGDILGGDSDNATLGLTYRVEGGFEKSQVSVNPLSALTPGVLRQIFKPGREKKRIEIPSDTVKDPGDLEPESDP